MEDVVEDVVEDAIEDEEEDEPEEESVSDAVLTAIITVGEVTEVDEDGKVLLDESAIEELEKGEETVSLSRG
ncbi:hypothetical protein PC116_g32967 [Phytophthora cactorum]|nr:hypothetical protein PC116_g32967 [Phytophthora cactorum]